MATDPRINAASFLLPLFEEDVSDDFSDDTFVSSKERKDHLMAQKETLKLQLRSFYRVSESYLRELRKFREELDGATRELELVNSELHVAAKKP